MIDREFESKSEIESKISEQSEEEEEEEERAKRRERQREREMDKETAMECNDQSNRNTIVWIRARLPMCILCNSCGHCIKKNTIFKSVGREIVSGESYLGIRVARFYFKCSKCSGEIIIKTDPKNEGYVIESGATESQKVSQAPTGNPTDSLRCQFSSQLEL